MDKHELEAAIEGILFTFGEAVDPSKIAKALDVDKKEIIDTIEDMKARWEEEGRGVVISEIDGAYQMCTSANIYEYLINNIHIEDEEIPVDNFDIYLENICEFLWINIDIL